MWLDLAVLDPEALDVLREHHGVVASHRPDISSHKILQLVDARARGKTSFTLRPAAGDRVLPAPTVCRRDPGGVTTQPADTSL